MIRNIMLLTKISTINYIQNINIIDKKTNRINKKSIYFWIFIIIMIALFFISNKAISFLKRTGNVGIFINIYSVFMFLILTMQATLICPNVFYFAKDIELLLPYPIKPVELFMAKFNTLLCMLYVSEIVFMIIPMIMYGIAMNIGWVFYFGLLIMLILFPIFIGGIISIINFLLINFMKIIKNENIYQILVATILIILIFVGEYFYVKNIVIKDPSLQNTLISLNDIATHVNKTIIVTNPLIDIMHNKNIFYNIVYLFIVYSVLSIILIIIGEKLYFKKLVSSFLLNNKKCKIIDLYNECKMQKPEKSYINNEFKFITRNIAFFMQCIFPIIMLLVAGVILSIYIKFNLILKDQDIMDFFKSLNLNIEGFCVFLIVCQALNSFINLSITSISRYGKNAVFFKYIPINLYKQFWLKNVTQIILSIIISLTICFIVKLLVSSISINYIFIMFINSIILGILNSILMLIVDLKRPFLNWNTEYEVIKQNGNKLFQYVYTIMIVLLLMYFINVLDTINFNIALIIITSILTMLIIITDRYVKNQIKKNKLFNKIS